MDGLGEIKTSTFIFFLKKSENHQPKTLPAKENLGSPGLAGEEVGFALGVGRRRR